MRQKHGVAGTHRIEFVGLVKRANYRTGVELGCGHGRLAAALMAGCPDLQLTSVDYFRRPEWEAAARQALAPYGDRCRLLQSSTHDAADQFADGSLDFVFIDAGHQYPSVADDIQRWWPKVRRGGWFGGHDFGSKHPGVDRAVAEVFGAKVGRLPGHIWWVTR